MQKQNHKEKTTQPVVYSPKNWDRAPASLEKISDLTLDWRLYPRQEVDQAVVQKYARALRAGAKFPRIRVGTFAGKKIIVDGAHRIRANELLKTEYIECSSLPFQTEAELFAEAVQSNGAHGKSFNETELKANIKRLKQYKLDINDIVSICHVPASEIRSEMVKPIISVTSPSGKKLLCSDIKPGEGGIQGIICLKNALMLVCNWAESNKIPSDEPTINELVARAQTALKKTQNGVQVNG